MQIEGEKQIQEEVACLLQFLNSRGNQKSLTSDL